MTSVDSESTALVPKPDTVSSQPPTPAWRFIFFGMMSLVVYNFFLQSLGFFKTCFGSNFGSESHIVYAGAANMIQICAIFVGSKVPATHGVVLSCIGLTIVAVLFPVLAQTHKLIFGLILSCGLGLFCAILQSTGSALAGLSSPEAIVYFYLGQSVSGLFPWPMIEGLNWMYRLLGSDAVSIETGVASVMDTRTAYTVLSFAGLLSLGFLPFYLFGIARNSEASQKSDVKGSIWVTFKSMWQWALCAWLLFATTFSVYPQLLLMWEPSYPQLYPAGEYFYSNMLIYVAIVFDIFGMYLPIMGAVMSSTLTVKICVGVRIILIPILFVFCPENDICRALACVFLAVSGAYLLSMVLQFGCTPPPDVDASFSAEIAGYILSFALCNGIVAGSLSSLLFSTAYGAVSLLWNSADK